MKSAEKYCLSLLRGRAYPQYFAVLFAPAGKRAAIAALYAFQLEILHIIETVKEPLLGEMRLQWWHDSLAGCFDSAEVKFGAEQKQEQSAKISAAEADGQSPVLAALAAAIRSYNLPLAPFLRLCEAARPCLYNEDLKRRDFEIYADSVYAAILRLACRILGGGDETADKVCRPGGLAQAVIFSMLLLKRGGNSLIPADILAAAGADRQSLKKAAQAQSDDSAAAAQESAQMALAAYFQENYQLFKQAERDLPSYLRPAFLPLAILPLYLQQAEKRRNSVGAMFAPALLSIQLKIARAALFNRF